jgi:hypothetical protein
MVFYLQQEEFRKMMPPETHEMFSSYCAGCGFLAAMLLVGALSLRHGLSRSRAAGKPRLLGKGNASIAD